MERPGPTGFTGRARIGSGNTRITRITGIGSERHARNTFGGDGSNGATEAHTGTHLRGWAFLIFIFDGKCA